MFSLDGVRILVDVIFFDPIQLDLVPHTIIS